MKSNIKENKLPVMKRSWFKLLCVTVLLFWLRYVIFYFWNDDKTEVSASSFSTIKRSKKNRSNCHRKFADNQMHVCGSVPAEEYEKMFDFSAPPGSDARSSPIGKVVKFTPEEEAMVTIITPANDPIYIDETAKSLFSQSFKLFKWIIVNDHSSSETFLMRYRRHDDIRIKVMDCDPESSMLCGLPRTRNTALSMVDTKYVLFLDDDDLIESTYLEKVVWFLESNDEYSYVNTFTVNYGARNALWDHTFFESSLNINRQTATALIRTSALKTVAGDKWPSTLFREEMSTGSEDWDLWLNLKSHDLHGATIPEYLFWYRIKEERRQWEFLENKERFNKKDGDGKSAQKYNGKTRQSLYPSLFVTGHVNPVLHDHFSDDLSKPAPFTNHQEKSSENFGNCVEPERHVIIIVPWLALGGADMVNVKLVQLLSEKNWKVTIVSTLCTSCSSGTSSSLDFFRPVVQQYTEDLFTLPHFLRVKDYGRFFLYLINSRRADAVLTSNSFAAYNLLPYLKTHAPSVVFSDYVHMRQLEWKVGAYFESPGDIVGGGYPRFSALFSDYLDVSMFVSDDERKWVAKTMGLEKPNDKQKVIYLGVDEDEYVLDYDVRRESRRILGLSDDTMCIVFSGRLVDQKRPDVLIRVYNKLIQQLQDLKVHLVIIGDGALKAQVVRFIKKHDIANQVTMLGKVTSDKMVSVMSAGDVIFLPSKMEGLSVALIEAMSVGLVPVVTNVGGHREIVRDGAGFLVDRDDESGMLEGLTKLALDPDYRKIMSKKARAVVEQDFLYKVMKENVHSSLVRAIDSIKSSQYDEQKAAMTKKDLPKMLKYISSSDNSVSSLATILNLKSKVQ